MAELRGLAEAASSQQGAGAPSAGGGDAAPLHTAEALRTQLVASVGQAVFDTAHTRLREACLFGDGDDDDAIANGGAQQLLGERYREALPLMLKLIYLEATTQMNAPW